MNIEKENKEIGKRIKLLREKKGESQEELGKAIGLSQNSISKIERGEVALTLENQLNIVAHYNTSHDYLCTGKNTDSFLNILNKYVSLKYEKLSIGSESFICPVLKINNIFYDYLIHSARAQDIQDMPDDIREMWLKKEVDNFYKRNKKNSFKEFKSVVPLPEQLINPDDSKSEWKQTDLLRELNNYLLND